MDIDSIPLRSLVRRESDPERLEAEQRAAALAVARGELERVAQARLALLSDDDLRHELLRLQHKATPAPMPPARAATLQALKAQCPEAVARRFTVAGTPDLDDFAEHLDEDIGVRVADDGLIEVERITPEASLVIADLPIAMYHHTSSALAEAIRTEGLKVGAPTNFFNTRQGVYVSTISAGDPVTVYSRRAARVHGGEPATLRVRRRLSELRPDPDDHDLAWAQGRQYVTAFVPPKDILWDAEAPVPEPSPVPAVVPIANASRRRQRPR